MGEFSGKVVIIGDSACGKSSIISMYINKKFNKDVDSTIGACYFLHKIVKDDITIKLSIWDTAGQEKYDSIASIYARNSDVIIIVCDSSCKDQVPSLTKWYNKIVKDLSNNEAITIVAANKIDLNPNPEDLQSIEKYANEINAQFYKTSAKENLNIQEMFEDISSQIFLRRKLPNIESFKLNSTKDFRLHKKKSCCT